jgi:3-oxoacyl-[acyl-carrier protein] reductase
MVNGRHQERPSGFAVTRQTRLALVTGASRGIGRAIAIALGEKGLRVVINYARSEDEAFQTAQMTAASGAKQTIVKQFDVSNSDEVDRAFAALKSEAGDVDILINNAGIAIDGLLLRCKNTDWEKQLSVNLSGAFYCAKAASKAMVRNHWGRIVNVSSVVGEMGSAGQIAYATAKAGLVGFTKSLAKELASRHITVNAVAPGYIDTDMTSRLTNTQKESAAAAIPLGYAGQPRDVAAAVAFLASDEARYITGQIMSINGGLYM